jgi:polyvinyl alcohol dehydrogenase (cytochrome)
MALSGRRLFAPVNDRSLSGPPRPGARPGLYALDIVDGSPLWQAPSDDSLCRGRALCVAGFQAPVTATPGLVLAGGMDGWLRIYAAGSGRLLWRHDTTEQVATVGGGTTQGGSIGGSAGPVAYHGLLIAESGYDFAGKMPGDALLVFEAAPISD